MPTERKCLRCGGAHLEPGQVQGVGRLYFRPKNVKFFSLHTADVPVEASICTDCGAIDLIGDIHKAQTLLDQAKPV